MWILHCGDTFMRMENKNTLFVSIDSSSNCRYERTCPMQDFGCTNSGPVHVGIGMAGKQADKIDKPQPSWSTYRYAATHLSSTLTDNTTNTGRATMATRRLK